MPFRRIDATDNPIVVVRRLQHSLRWLVLGLVMIVLAGGCGAWYLNARRTFVQDRLTNVACLALHYLPPTSPFSQDLRAQFTHCPAYMPPKSARRSAVPAKKTALRRTVAAGQSPAAPAGTSTGRSARVRVSPAPVPHSPAQGRGTTPATTSTSAAASTPAGPAPTSPGGLLSTVCQIVELRPLCG